MISKKFAELMRGSLSVSSEVGSGAAFRLDIQVAIADVSLMRIGKSHRKVMGMEPGQPSFRLLLADDKEDNRKLLIGMLEPFGFELREASDGREAIEIWETWKPHLICMDIRMPVMDGFEATKAIRKRESRNSESEAGGSQIRTAVIAVTASVFEEDREAVLAAGCDDFLRKPLRESDLFDLLAKHLNIRFVYAETPDVTEVRNRVPALEILTADRLQELPENWLTELRESAETTHPDRAEAIVNKIREQDEELADALDEVVNEFRFDIVLDILAEIKK